MKPKYIKEKLDGTLVYPDCPKSIQSKEDLIKWFEHTNQICCNIDDKTHLLNLLPSQYIVEQSTTEIKIKFSRCKYLARVFFTGKECYRVLL